MLEVGADKYVPTLQHSGWGGGWGGVADDVELEVRDESAVVARRAARGASPI